MIEDTEGATSVEEVEDEVMSEEPVNEVEKWKGEAAKMQSLRDKDKARYEKELSDWYRMRDLAEQKPDVVKDFIGKLTGEPQEDVPDDFNIIDAYENPNSPSYKHRIAEQAEITQQVVSDLLRKERERQFVGEMERELRSKHQLSDDQVKGYFDWYSQPKDRLPTDVMVKLYLESTGQKQSKTSTSLDAVRSSKSNPASAGSMSGQAEARLNPNEVLKRAIMEADGKARPSIIAKK